jgi:hypothetical protein
MRPYSLIVFTLAAAALAGCAAPRPTPVVINTPPAVVTTTASTQGTSTVRSAQVVAVESATPGQSTATASSGSAGGTTVASGPARLTVRFADGTESAYEVLQPATGFRVGEPISVITNGAAITIMR